MLEHGANLYGELLAALAALLKAMTNDAFRALFARLGTDASEVINATVHPTAMRANYATGPDDAFKERIVGFDLRQHVLPVVLTDAQDDGGLFGFRF